MYLATGYRPCVLGERTHLEKFEQTNGDLPPMYYSGVKKHLVQDIIFDEFVRSEIGLDCSRRFESMYPPEETTGKNVGIYVFTRERKGSNGESLVEQETFDGNGVRKFIADFENQGVYILAYMLYKSYGITVNQEWFDKHVKTVLDREYSEDLAKGTYQYMKIPEEINKRITDHDLTHLDEGPIPYENYLRMYERVIAEMPEIDMERLDREEAMKKADKTHLDD
jgi:hypothetical protein